MKETASKHGNRYVPVILVGLLGLLVFSIVLLSLVPPVSKDELVHHLAVPKLYLKHGGMFEIPFMPFSYYPMNLDLLYLIPLYFGNDIVPKFIHFTFALLTAWLIFRYLKKRTDWTYALFGVLFFLSTPLIIKLSITAYIDLGIIFFSTAALLFLMEWVDSGFKMKFLVIAAVFCGLGLGTKYNGLITLFLLTLFVPLLYGRAGGTKKAGLFRPAWHGLVFLLVSLTVFSPWMLRNYSWTRNPIYPLYNHWFNAPGPAIEAAASDKSESEESRGGHGIFVYRRAIYGEQGWQIALLPFRIFFEGKDADPQRFDGKLNPFLFLYLLFAFYRSREDPYAEKREKAFLLAFVVLFFAYAFFSVDLRMRYISPILPPLVILSVFGLRNLIRRAKAASSQKARRGAVGLLYGTVLFSLAMNGEYLLTQFRYVDPFTFIAGRLGREEYLARFLPEYPSVQHINRHLPSDAVVSLVFVGNRGYYLDRTYVYGEETLRQLIKKGPSPEDVLSGLKKSRITHFLVRDHLLEKWSLINFTEQEKERMHKFFAKYGHAVHQSRGFTLWSLRNTSP